MPQETNLNVSPYFDDFDQDNNYYKVLFKPGYPIQARELTTLQSILQNQTESLGKHLFKEGSVVIPGQLRYDNPIFAVEIEPQYNGVPISLYFNQLLNKKVTGSNSGVTGEIFYILSNADSERNNYTLYVRYVTSGGADFANKSFESGETLLLESPLTYGNFTIPSGQGICNTISNNATSQGSSVVVADGIYFARGIFINVEEQRILLDQYGTTPSYKVGFDVVESIVNVNEDSSLFDNAQGFSNYAAPGADRFRIKLELAKKDIDDLATESFIEILRVQNGVPQFFNKNTQYNLIRDELARRTYEESGNYFVKPFTIFVRDSLNDRVLNNGIYFDNQSTVNGNNPSEDMMVYQIGPGKAYVNGYDVETISPRLLEVPKTRVTSTLYNQVLQYNAGLSVVVNNTYGVPPIGLGTTAVVSLMDSRIGSSEHVSAGTTIGLARVYDYIPASEYVNDSSRLFLRLYDVQTYTTVSLASTVTQTVPALIKGKKSNATGYLKSNVSSGSTLTLYQVSGKFLENEPIIINGIDNGRLIKSVKDYSLNDVKSIYSPRVGVTTFNADVILGRKSYISKPGTTFQITAASGSPSISTVSAGLENTFINILLPGDIISYASSDYTSDPVYNRVVSVSAGGTSFTITGITSVPGVCSGSLSTTTRTLTNIIKLSPSIASKNSSLLTKLNKNNISSVELENNEILQRRFFSNVSLSSNYSLTIQLLENDVYFAEFDEDLFMICYSDGKVESISPEMYNLDVTGKTLTFKQLSKNSGTANIITTVVNNKPNSKLKKLNTVSSLIISRSKLTGSGSGTNSLQDGLTYSQIYGVRVQDEEICLNVPDVVRVLAVYESSTSSDPALPDLQLTSFDGTSGNNQDFEIGERIIGTISGAVALVVKRIGTDRLEYVYLNTFQFLDGEIVQGKTSTTKAVIIKKNLGDKNITQNFILDNGQRETIYDYSRIIRKKNVAEPTKRLKVIFQNYIIDSSDDGEFITANSYPSEGFKYDVPSYGDIRLSDYIDIRPRVSNYVIGGSSKSPFEFDTRNFSSNGQYSKYTLAPGENIVLSYSYYLPRIDRIYLNSDGTFEVSSGVPSENPVAPPQKTNLLDIGTIYLPPYIYDVKNVNVDMSQHKRYRMSDIALLESRIEKVEKFTTLSMLESKTENFTIKDAETGLDRFKCGFFVDNFSTHQYHDLQNPSFRSAIDTSTNTLRPKHYTTSIELQLGSESISGVTSSFSPNKDHTYVTDLGSPGIKKTGDLITLDYNEILYFDQPYATRTESVTPFLVRYWTGSITLTPPIDSWVDEQIITTTSFNEITTLKDALPDENITIVNNVTIDNVVFVNPATIQTGIPGFDWIGNARSVLSGISRIGGIRVDLGNLNSLNDQNIRGESGISGNLLHLEVWKRRTTQADIDLINRLLPPDVAQQFITQIQTENGQNRVLIDFVQGGGATITETTNVSTTTRTESSSSTIIIPPEIITSDTSSTSTSHYTEEIRYLRSRNIEFDVRGLKPVTKFYPFFEGINVGNYIIPKLLEIEMISGRFEIGETVESDPHFTSRNIKFRLCSPSHKSGRHNDPQRKFLYIPYTQTAPPENYTESSTFLNIDTKSLQLASETRFFGSIAPNMKLIGKNSKAVAKITNIRLVSDNTGRLIGSLFVPDPNTVGNPRWINGENTFTVIDVPFLDQIQWDEFIANERTTQSAAESEFSSSGTLSVTENNIVTTRNITIIPSRNITTTTVNNTSTNTTTTTRTQQGNQATVWEVHDPLAQSFYVKEETGVFLTSVDVYFETKDENVPVTLQLRPMTSGVPSNMVIPFSEVTLDSDQINLSTNGSVPTRFTFPSPVYLSGPQEQNIRNAPIGSQQTAEYAVVLLSKSPQYRVFISQLGENDILTNIKLSQQYTLGSLFKSQNGSVWSPSQLEDLKYKLYRASFVKEGLVRFYNTKLSLKNKKKTVTSANNLLPLSKTVIVGVGSTGYNPSLVIPGVTIVRGSSTSKLAGIAGSIRVAIGVTVINSGIGYTPSSGSYVFLNQQLNTETGFGEGAYADITVTNGKVTNVSITSGGTGYVEGDSLLIPSMGDNVGFGARVSVSNISSRNTFILKDVQGNFSPSGITTLSYINSSNATVLVAAGASVISYREDLYNDGIHMKVYHKNHGMHSAENYVSISEMRPSNIESNTVTSDIITSTETSTISVISGVGFTQFEGSPVSIANTGYVLIGKEVIGYTQVSGNTLSATSGYPIERGVDGTDVQGYDSGVPVYKYEFNGISLRRINKIHNLAESTSKKHPINLDSYFIKIDPPSGRFFKESLQTGQSGTVLSSNIQYEAITPNINYILPEKTNINTRIRTFSGTSIGGNEKSFVDNGFENIPINGTTYFAEPKLVCSEINEEVFITESPGNRSLTMEFLMNSTDNTVSPVIDLAKVSAILTTNLINNPVGIQTASLYADDDRVRSLYNDPHAAIYISKPIRLKLAANSLKVLLSASRNNTNDVRVLYQLFRDDAPEASQNFELFPGYSNYQVDGIGIKRVKDESKNDGSADFYVAQTSDRSFKDYEYSVDNLPPFNGFAIKIVMAGRNQATPPIISQLRAIATIKPEV